MSNVVDLYQVTYVQGDSIIVHMDHTDLVFKHRDKMYMANFSDWLVEAKIQELFTNLSLLTVSERESTYMHKQVRMALEAGKFLKALGYPTEREALGIVSHGNVLNVPYP